MSFNALLKEGVFYTDTPLPHFKESGFSPYFEIYLTNGSEKTYLSEILEPFIDTEIAFSMHHLIDTSKSKAWGYGSCFMENVGWCPCNHHNESERNKVMNISVEGHLRKEGRYHLLIEKFDGDRFYIPFYLLVGHKGRVACANIIDVGNMKDIVMSDENLAEQLSNLTEMMGKLKEITK